MPVEYTSGQIYFSGLGSGADFNSMITKLLEVESNHAKQLLQWKNDWEDKISAFQDLNTKMATLQNKIGKISTMDNFLVKMATISSPYGNNVLFATLDSKAEVGSHSIEVDQMAQSSTYIHDTGFASRTTAMGLDGTFEYTYTAPGKSPVTRTLNVGSSTSLEGLCNQINSDPENPGVRASVIRNGDDYYLQIRGMDLGAGANLTIGSSSTLPLPGFGAGDFTQVQANQDAKFKVNGLELTASSNTITEVIPGVTMNLTSVGQSQITISVDREAIEANINEFVELVNEMRTTISEMTKVTSTYSNKITGSTLTGNYGVQLIKTRLDNAVTSATLGFAAATAYDNQGDKYSTLSQLGIRTDVNQSSSTYGLLIFDKNFFDEDQLKKALDTDIEAVAKFFAADGIGNQMVTSGNFSYYSKINTITKPGSYNVTYDIDASGNIINAMIDGKPASVDNDERTITSTNGNSRGVIVKVNDLTANTKSEGVVQIQQGLIGFVNDTLIDITKDGTAEQDRGPLKILEGRYQDIVANIDKKIIKEDERLIRMERDLRSRFARLEALLGTYDQTAQQLTSQISQLKGIGSD